MDTIKKPGYYKWQYGRWDYLGTTMDDYFAENNEGEVYNEKCAHGVCCDDDDLEFVLNAICGDGVEGHCDPAGEPGPVGMRGPSEEWLAGYEMGYTSGQIGCITNEDVDILYEDGFADGFLEAIEFYWDDLIWHDEPEDNILFEGIRVVWKDGHYDFYYNVTDEDLKDIIMREDYGYIVKLNANGERL